MPDLNYYSIDYTQIRRTRNEITSISGTSEKWVNAVNLGLELVCLFTSLLISSSATMKVMKVSEILIFLSTAI